MITYKNTLTSTVIVIVSVCIFSILLMTIVHFIISLYSGLTCVLWNEGCRR